MAVSRRRFAATGVALALTLALGACTSDDADEGQGTEAISVEGKAPLTMQGEATWSAEILQDAPVRVTPLGVLTFSAEKSVEGREYTPVLLSPQDGSVRWDGKPIESEAMPSLHWIEQGRSRWAIAEVVTGNTVSLYSWNGLASHTDTDLASSSSFEGKKAPPTVTFTHSGVLVTGADKTAAEPLVYWPEDANLTRYTGGPERGGESGSPVAAYSDGFLVTFPDGGFSLATDTGGWTSSGAAPEDANPKSGVVLTHGHGYVISEWARPSDQDDGTTILAVHSVSSGRLFVQHDVPKEQATALKGQKDAGAPLVTDGSDWLIWGQFGFNLTNGETTLYTLEQGTPTAVIDGMLYIRGAYTPLPGAEETSPSDGGGESPSDGGGDAASAGETLDPDAPQGFSGVTGVDLRTGLPMSGLPSLYPIGRTSTGQVILRDDAKQAIYSVGLR